MVERAFYNTTLSQTFSPCGHYLFTGNIYGEIVVFNLKKNLMTFSGEMSVHPTHRITCPSQICSLTSTSQFLIAGCVGEVFAWAWNKVKVPNVEPRTVAWTIQIPVSRDTFQKVDVNSIIVVPEDDGENGCTNSIFAGCGDSKVYLFNLDNGKLIRTFEAHENFIHSISKLGTTLATASEDGSVRLWDTRQAAVTALIWPFKTEKIARPHIGKWIGDVDLNEQWLVCGGGPRLSMWHIRTLSLGTTFTSLEDKGLHVVKFLEDKVLAGGVSPYVSVLSYKDKVHAEIETSQTTVYSVINQLEPMKVMSIAGSSSKVDLCTNFNYRDHILSLL